MSDSENSLLTHLAVLDDLIQVIYQGHLKFVVLSAVDDDAWNVHVGLTSRTKEGRWWTGQWKQEDVEKIMGPRSSSSLMETFVQKLKTAFTEGDMFIGNWNPSKGAEINLAIGTTDKKPLSISLTELSSQDAAAFASDVLFRIALQAQKHGCQLQPSTLPAPPVLPDMPRQPRSRTTTVKDSSSTSTSTSSKSAQDPETLKEIEELRSQLAEAHAETTKSPKSKAPSNPLQLRMTRGLAAASHVKGASLANPNKRVRKIKEIEFEDED
ncbi:hypothetical protein OE88DRAFT_1122975 [Heliocybe sulcata]|uniref:Uncharacterized protein n=1 Tax=Heliocybe sulcata TaxID=5364 RepID=A0A5C3N913_9AGAM|nr:hypothetical protein OE88DRAFT_1122975 [Heliocybe sulcata]